MRTLPALRPLARVLGGLVIASFAAGCAPTCGDEVAQIEALLSGESLVIDPACVVRTSVTIPAGATVSAHFDLPADASIHLTPAPAGVQVTTLLNARIDGGGARASVLVEGAGAARIERLDADLERGVAVAALEGAQVTIVESRLEGNVDPEALLSLPNPAPPDRFATFGVVALSGASVTIEATVEATFIERFATAGVGCGGGSLTLRNVMLVENRGVSVLSVDCTLAIATVAIDRTLSSPGLPGIGIAASSSMIDANGLMLHASPGFGLFATDTEVNLSQVRVDGLEQAGLWVEGGSSLTVTNGTLTENGGAAIAAVGASALSLTDCQVTDTHEAPLPLSGGFAAEMLGDGVHVAELPGTELSVALTRVGVGGNARVGLVLDGGGDALTLALEDVEVAAPGTALGAIAQRVADLPPDWDSDVVRFDSAARDAVASELTVSDGTPFGILMPPTLAP